MADKMNPSLIEALQEVDRGGLVFSIETDQEAVAIALESLGHSRHAEEIETMDPGEYYELIKTMKNRNLLN